MAFTIEGNTITLTRGDTLKAVVTPKYKDGEDYVPAAGDVIRFALKRRYSDADVLIEKEIPTDTFLLHLEPNDTKALDFGRYVYDIELTYANGDVDTFIDRATFIISEEVD